MKTKTEKEQIAERLNTLGDIITMQANRSTALLSKIQRVSEYVLYPPKRVIELKKMYDLGTATSEALLEYRALLTEKYNQA